MCCLPLCTAIVSPTKSGRMVERRDQVLIGRLSLVARAVSTFFMRWRSTNGPFLMERAMCYLLTDGLGITPADDHAVGALVLARLVPLGEHAPRAHRVLRRRRLAFAAAVRMVDRIHRAAAHRRSHAAPTHTARLADRFERMLFIPDFAYRGPAADMHFADFARTQSQLRVIALAREQLHRSPGRTRKLRAFAGQHLDAMDGGTDRDILERKRVAGFDRRFRPRVELCAFRHALCGNDVTAFTVCIAQKRQMRAAVRIVFDAFHPSRDPVLVALEIDDAIVLLVPAAFVTHGEMAVGVAARFLRLALDEVRLRLALMQTRRDDLDELSPPGRGGFDFDQHYLLSPSAKLISWPGFRHT